MENNKAFVAVLNNLRPIDGADRIVQAELTIKGVPITKLVVGADTEPGAKVVYFDSNMCLNENTILKDYPNLARYLGKRGRVKTVKLKGVYSDGLGVPIEQFTKYDKKAITWEEGYSFNSIGNVDICHKYIPPARKVPPNNNSRKNKGKFISRVVPGQFHFHIDTPQLARNIEDIELTDVISITRKMHGTSCITGYNLVKRKLTIRDKIAKIMGVKVKETEYDYLYSSRRVIKNEATDSGFYTTDIWTEAGKQVQVGLKKGETVYYEIVGFQSNGAWLQKYYDYGCNPGSFKIYIYRITKTGEDGHVTEYPWAAVKGRCRELGINHVPEYYFGKVYDWIKWSDIKDSKEWRREFITQLQNVYLNKTVEGNLSKKVPDEGIVIRKETGDIDVFKLKDPAFLAFETKMAEDESDNVEDVG